MKHEFNQAVVKEPLYLQSRVIEHEQMAHSEYMTSGNDLPISKPDTENLMMLQACLTTGLDSLITAAE
jgi:hypothetical protein